MSNQIAYFSATVFLSGLIGAICANRFFASPGDPSGQSISFGVFGLLGAIGHYVWTSVVRRQS